MRESDLPSPMIGGKGHHLRRISAQSISQMEINSYSNGRHPHAKALSDFFTACATALASLVPVAPVMAFTPTSKSYSIAAGASQAGPALNKGGSEGVVTYTSATPAKATVDPVTGAVTPIATGTSVITASITDSGGFLAGTQTYIATVTA
jgi:hypothetical protein